MFFKPCACVHSAGVAYDDNTNITKPAHVDQGLWEDRLGEYLAASTLYTKAMAAINERLQAGLVPAVNQFRDEAVALHVLTKARTALLGLCLSPPTERLVNRSLGWRYSPSA